MKTLLLALGVVTFVCLDLGDTMECHSCTGRLCRTFAKCPDGQFCFRRENRTGIISKQISRIVKGCTDTCADPGENEKVMYCAFDKCNW
ncbi:toxin 3FTx-Dis4-like [Ahaetulla prasina]|uniref:toxin 3FTx-Dis4-like n=1 Tax=Ahaetulla prasina TaxID=499056 RepID=UPI0026483302|nr:toxin 3FTx-Dis4-like [Ahaetulla prasina]